LGVAALPSVGRAHFLFATLDPAAKTVAIGLQENPTQAPVPLGERIPRVKAFSKSATTIALKGEGNWLKGTATDDCVAVALDYGVLDKSDQGRGVFWLNYFAKAALSPAASQVKLGLPVELSFSKGADGKSIISVYDKGQPASAAEVVIEEPDGTVAFEGKTGPDGTIAIPASSGLLAVRALVTSNVKGTHDGKSYDLVRSYCTLTVPTGPPVAVKPSGKPFTRLLSESFGDNHDVVGNTAFVNTLMAGKLTKVQAEAHLQQRALVHQAVDKVLLAADSSKFVPYGPQQKEVIALLRKDLVGMGSSWPADAKAWDLTKKMIADIEESAKKGPYFALGVFHVYFGGITHGGRDIGAIIGKVVNHEMSYYLKSDGYRAYATQVNLITDPEAQKEMIRGGQAAYRYIIASSDDPVFKK
jgi:hypothetical protein